MQAFPKPRLAKFEAHVVDDALGQLRDKRLDPVQLPGKILVAMTFAIELAATGEPPGSKRITCRPLNPRNALSMRGFAPLHSGPPRPLPKGGIAIERNSPPRTIIARSLDPLTVSANGPRRRRYLGMSTM